MSKYPVEIGDDEGVADALNYLLSGPGGLGQDFQGYQQWTPGYLTGNFRTPYTQISYNCVCDGTSGTYTIIAVPTFNSLNLNVGMTVSGYGITPGTVITAIGTQTTDGTDITLDQPLTNDVYNDLTFEPNPQPLLYVAPIALSTSTWLNPYTWRFDFATPQAAPPFVPGNNVNVSGVTPSDYDGGYSPIGITECTTTYCVAKTTNAYPDPGPGTGGTIYYYNTTSAPSVFAISTDCNSKVTVQGGTDRVFISAQLTNILSYTATTSSDLNYGVAINRYRGYPNNDIANPGFFFEPDILVAKKVYQFSGLTGTGTLPEVETIFSNFPDANITPGYYWYIVDVSFQVTNGGDLQVTKNQLGLRSLSTQVVKQ